MAVSLLDNATTKALAQATANRFSFGGSVLPFTNYNLPLAK